MPGPITRLTPDYFKILGPLLALLIVVFLLRLAAGLLRGDAGKSLPYRLRDGLLSPAEMAFYGALQLAVQSGFTICPKVRLADLFFVTNGEIGSLNKITSKHVDFVLCDPQNLQPVLGVELDDSSHQERTRIERDEFVNGVFKAAGLPLLRVPVQHRYHPGKLLAAIQESIDANSQTAVEALHLDESAPLCPHCEIPMVLRIAQRGTNRGSQFYGCANYPECRKTASISS